MPARSLAAAPVCVWVASVAALLTLSSVAPAVHCWQDPVVFHTNGLRLASSTSQRSHNAYWKCDPNHVGYCDGVTHGPCRTDLRSLGARSACYPLPSGAVPGATRADTHHTPEGMEYATGERLGLLPVDDPSTPRTSRLGTVGPAPGGAAMPANAPGGAAWIDALQTLGGGTTGTAETANQ